ncbi:hypothetical protein DFR86_05390 [Acidianus sulfidivorans JP7]|uniref:Cytochrome c domain-containing protein n=1 Tax=Acidianus sulfidivorans JP7 TaxID=619593 RepID=A0A2U9IM11_9CREN|nr:Sjogren's syndrome/scleroderma autoantigen 1 family protein [Acidianus sulfidivorans]AWR97051.1 hypothetical protein DFR86_05390 [Acidianus sulfidivorans JP7]
MTDDSVRKAAELLRQGATMLEESCPVCHSPLFKLKSGEVICPIHGRVYLVKSDEEEAKIKREFTLDSVESILIDGISIVAKKIKEDPMDGDNLMQMIKYLDALERLRRITSQHSK